MHQSRKFRYINESFVCENCGNEVLPLSSGCRNHCPFCLSSKHVDKDNPGDRNSECGGIMKAVSYELGGKKGIVLTFRCEKCSKEIRNIASHEEAIQPDNYDLILELGKPKN